jgi:hypothetical protein
MRKAATGEESKLPAGFTLERYLGKKREPKTAWRCGHIIQDPVQEKNVESVTFLSQSLIVTATNDSGWKKLTQ